ncbi:MAG: MFS transporter, partial [Acidobacteriaceae bacterium]|nr:MFS transporter [Acidobacteriaceae bacterium]
RIGGSIAPPLTAAIAARLGWRAVFLVFAGLGILWTPVWLWGVPRSEGQPVRRIKAERGKLPSSTPFFALLIASICYTGMWQFYVTWFPTYLITHIGMSATQAGFFAAVPFVGGLAGCFVGGIISDRISRRYGLRAGRRTFGIAILLLTAVLIFAGMRSVTVPTGALLIALAPGIGDMLLGVSWAVAVDIAPVSPGAVSGFVNAASNLGAFVFPVFIGAVLQKSGNWQLILAIAVICTTVAAVAWSFIDLPEWRRRG